MKPINIPTPGCSPISSNCVIWDGPDIPCINLCKGDTVTTVVYELGKQLCEILDMLKVDNYDLSCLNLSSCAPPDFQALVQLIINKLCEALNITPDQGGSNPGCPDCNVTIAPCFQYENPANGDLVTTLVLHDYVQLIGVRLCEILTQLGINTGSIENQGSRLGVVETKVQVLENQPVQLPNLTPACVLPAQPTSITDIVVALEQQFCELRAATGTPTQLFSSVAVQCPNLNNSPALGSSGGTMSAMSGWVTNVQNVADSFTNMWLTICDLRSAVTNIKTNCCPTSCDGVAIYMVATLPSSTSVVLYFTGTIPSNLQQCAADLTMFTIADQSGHSINVSLNLVANMNNPSGYPINIGSSPLNTADNLTITSTVCLKDSNTGTQCQSVLNYVLVNPGNCPTITYIPALTSVSFSFYHSSGSVTYTVELWNSTGTVLLQSMVFPVTNPQTISGDFPSLSAGTVYKLRTKVTSTSGTSVCPFTAVTTLPDECPPVQNVTVTLTI